MTGAMNAAPHAAARSGMSVIAQMVLRLIEITEADGMAWAAERPIVEAAARSHSAEQIPLTFSFQLWERAMKTLRDPGLPMRVAHACDHRSYEVLGYLAVASASLREVLQHFARYMRLLTTASLWNLTENHDQVIIWMTPSGPLPLAARVATESALAQLLQLSRALTGSHITPIEARFRHAEPPDITAHQRFFGCPVRFEREHAGIVLTRSAIDTPLAKPDPTLVRILTAHADALMAKIPDTTTVAAQLRSMVLRELHQSDLAAGEMAKRMGMSERTLRRRLADEATSFQRVLEDARRDSALSYLEEGRSIAEVAFLVGFSEPSAFHRSFKRWTGMTPDAYRRQHTGTASS